MEASWRGDTSVFDEKQQIFWGRGRYLRAGHCCFCGALRRESTGHGERAAFSLHLEPHTGTQPDLVRA